MKHLLTLLLCICLSIGSVEARTTISRDVNDLPAKARTMLKDNFGINKVCKIKIEDKKFGGKTYEVTLKDGTEIDFNASGHWQDIDCGKKAVPSKLILPAILRYVKSNHPGKKIVQIEVKHSKYKVELSNGLDLEFSRDGRFLKVEH